MKTALLLLFCVVGVSQAQYVAEIRLEYWSMKLHANEWEGALYAHLTLNGQLVDPQTAGLSYVWYWKWEDGPPFDFEPFHYTYRRNLDGINLGRWREYFVEIRLNNTLIATSPVIRIISPQASQQVTADSRTAGGSLALENRISFWSMSVPITPNDWHPDKIAQPGGPIPLIRNTDHFLRTEPDILTQPVERFHRWTTNENRVDFRNHDEFFISSNTNVMTTNYRPFLTDALLRGYLIENSSSAGSFVEYRDPWLRDTTDSLFLDGLKGYRNLGMGAPFKSDPQPIQPNTSNKYKGVFLEQYVEDGIYYSVRAPLSNEASGFTWLFQDWQTSGGVGLQQVGPNPSGYDQKAAIFTGANAVVSARYKAHLGSSLATATSSNSQRKYAADDGYSAALSALTYASSAHIWLSDATGWGAPLNPEIRVSDPDQNYTYSAPSCFAISGDLSLAGESGATAPQVGMVYQWQGSNVLGVAFREKRTGTLRPPQYLESSLLVC